MGPEPSGAGRGSLRRRHAGDAQVPALSDPASHWTAAQAGPASFAYCSNYLIDLDHAVIVDVEPPRPARSPPAAPWWSAPRSGRGCTPSAGPPTPPPARPRCSNGWSMIARSRHTSRFDKSRRKDGTFSREDFTNDPVSDLYHCPGAHELKRNRRAFPRRGPAASRRHPPPPRQQGRLRHLRAQEPLLPEGVGAQGDPLDPRSRPRCGARDRQDRRLLDLHATAEKGRDALRGRCASIRRICLSDNQKRSLMARSSRHQ
jgi:hypothetical protein